MFEAVLACVILLVQVVVLVYVAVLMISSSKLHCRMMQRPEQFSQDGGLSEPKRKW